MTASGYEEAARFLHGQKILSSEDIAYPVQLVGLAAILSIIGFPHELRRSKLEQWWWCGIFGEYCMKLQIFFNLVTFSMAEIPTRQCFQQLASTLNRYYYSESLNI